MTIRNYSNLAPPVALNAAVDADDTLLTVGSTTNYPPIPFLLGLERGSPNEEVCLCTAKTGTTFTVQRGYDGTTGKAHAIGATLEHTVAAIDYFEANQFVNLLTTKGDLLVRDADSNERLAVGTNGHILVADSAVALGIKWALNQVIDLVQAKGDLILGSAADAIGRLAIGADGEALVARSSEPLGVGWEVHAQADVQEFTSSGVWQKPAGAKMVYVELIGAGGGGARSEWTASRPASGAPGGGGGGYNDKWFGADELGATETVTIGAGGLGATANATAGGAGGSTAFGGDRLDVDSGTGNFTTQNTGGEMPFGTQGFEWSRYDGGDGGQGAGASLPGRGHSSVHGGGGGGGGGGISAGPTTYFNGAKGGFRGHTITGGGSQNDEGGVVPGGVGPNGTALGQGGGGGAANPSGAGGKGGDAGQCAGGGGGGMGTTVSGNGGNGGPGFCRVTTYF